MMRFGLAVAAAALLMTAPLVAQAAAPAAPDAQQRFDAAVDQAKAAMLTDPRHAFAAARRASMLAGALPAASDRALATATTLWLEAEATYRTDDVTSAAPLIERAYALVDANDRGSQLEANILLTRGSVHDKQVEVAKALDDFQRAHRLFSAHGDRRHEAISLICIALLYFDAKDYDSTLHNLAEALEAYPADPSLALSINTARGNAFQDLGRYAEADTAFRQALDAARSLNSPALISTVYGNMARNQLLIGRVNAAEQLISAAQATSGGENTKQLQALAAQVALQRGHPNDAARLIDRVFAGIDLRTTDATFRYLHLTAVDAYRASGQPALALAHLEALKRLDDEATKLATKASTALLAARFDSANQDAKITRLRDAERLRVARDALQRAKTERTIFLIGGGAGLAIMVSLAVALFTIRRSRDQVRAANDDLAVTNGALGKALAAKTEFLATTSHEIRTPLNGILGMTQVMLADGKLTGPTRDRLTVVHDAGLTMRALVDDILDVAKMETGNLGLEVAPFDPAACVREASAIWAEQARAKGLGFTIDVTHCPVRVTGDATRVRQIVFNLLSNACKFTATGTIAVVADATAQGALRLVIRDTGVGIAADKHTAVFEAFRQADTSTTRQFGGTGLGLAICRNLADAMGGTISVDSAAGQGATFTVTLPLPAAAAAPVPAIAAAIGPRVLVVDRNPIARAMLRTLLAPHAGEVLFAGTTAEVAAAAPPTHVLIDGATARAHGDAAAFVAAVLAAAPDAAATVLWPAGDGPDRRTVQALVSAPILVKPITGAALIAAMFSPSAQESDHPRLVSQAA